MKIFLTGAAGYIGGAVAARLVADGHQVRGLVRNPAHEPLLTQAGITPVRGTLDDTDLLAAEATTADAVVNAANSDHRGAAETLLGALRHTGKPLVHTSGSSLIGDDAQGDHTTAAIHDDTDQIVADAHPMRQARFAIDTMLVQAADDDVRTVVLCNSLIYGTGREPRPDTVLLPPLIDQARASGIVRVVGQGHNRWSNVHIDDVAALYSHVLTNPAATGFYFVEGGEASFREIGTAIADRFGLGPVQPWSLDEAGQAWGEGFARYALGSNSRVRATRARQLGWTPAHTSITTWIRDEMKIG
ncbi:NAD-dependent epimerase/dehydratase family protein [Actinoplanes bogorensis]|uniref:NAD-dependent epimerase/dehydratase family protein n=1 Tax=Paractinoplanes bogorensis TaxID=1610840 RepID=A0ABS5YTX5_9ACTN|nr:NAD-dependent epimerase/dehydratase family protein [Actinoplanes bogorensis]MBU2665520.1 NAD-dependent epimerase/dehydratase family protein [Actinoplanes bogorensis]